MPIPQFDPVHVTGGTVQVSGPMPFDADAAGTPVPFLNAAYIHFSVVQGDVILSGSTVATPRWHGVASPPEGASATTLDPEKPAVCAGVAVICRSRPGAAAFEVLTWSESKEVEEGALTDSNPKR